MPCSRNGTAACMHPPLRIHGKLAAVGIYHPDVPIVVNAAPSATTPVPTAAAALSPAPPTTIVSAFRPVRSAISGRRVPVISQDSYTLPRRGLSISRRAEPPQTSSGPAHPKLHAAGIRNFRCKHAGQHLPDIVLWQYMAAF